jgi:hypothetical protein
MYVFIGDLFNDVGSSDYFASSDKTNKLERIRKEAVVAYFKLLFRSLLGGAEETYENLSRDDSLRAEIRTRELLKKKQA